MGTTPKRSTRTVALLVGALALLVAAPLESSAAPVATQVAAATSKPHITSQPRSSLAVAGRHAAILVAASGPKLRYQWWRRDPGNAWSQIPGATSRRYSTVALKTATERQYRVVVSNAGGSVRSRVATVFTVSCFGAGSMSPALAGCPTAALARMVKPSPNQVAHDWGGNSQCWSGGNASALLRCRFPSTGPRAGIPHVALVGDSHARMYLPALQWLQQRGKLTFDTYLKGSCGWSKTPAVRGTVGSHEQRAFTASCTAWRKKLAARLIRTPGEYDAVITSASRGTRALYPKSARTSAQKRAVRRDGAVAAWKPVLARGVPVLVIRDSPRPGTATKSCLLGKGKNKPSVCAFSKAHGNAIYDPLPGAVARSGSRAHLVDLTWRFCTSTKCPVVIGGANVYRDDHHVSVTYTTTLAPYIWRQISRYLA